MNGAKTPYKCLNCWEAQEIPPETAVDDRSKILESISLVSNDPFKEPLCSLQTPMPIHEELLVMLCWLVFFAVPLWGPFIMLWVLYTNLYTGLICLVCCVLISYWPSTYRPSLCYHYLASLTLKYFSFRAIWTQTVPKGTYIGVTPPHGLFPIAGICGVFALPRFGGFGGRGAAASAILSVPFIGNLLRSLGCVEAH